MSKSIARTIAVTFIIFAVSILAYNNIYAKNIEENKETANWKVTFTNEGKDLSETKEIKFKSIENQNVVTNKIAPGTKMTAEVEINIEKADKDAEIRVKVDDSDLDDVFSIIKTIDNTVVESDKPIMAKQGEKKKLNLELEWNDCDEKDLSIIQNNNEIEIPIKFEVYSHI